MAVLNRQGTFFCPKYGDIAIVRGGLRLGYGFLWDHVQGFERLILCWSSI